MRRLLFALFLIISNLAMAQGEIDKILFGEKIPTKTLSESLREMNPKPQITTITDTNGRTVTQVCYYLVRLNSYDCYIE